MLFLLQSRPASRRSERLLPERHSGRALQGKLLQSPVYVSWPVMNAPLIQMVSLKHERCIPEALHPIDHVPEQEDRCRLALRQYIHCRCVASS